LNWLYKTFSKA